jgi:hypothetical protein
MASLGLISPGVCCGRSVAYVASYVLRVRKVASLLNLYCGVACLVCVFFLDCNNVQEAAACVTMIVGAMSELPSLIVSGSATRSQHISFATV